MNLQILVFKKGKDVTGHNVSRPDFIEGHFTDRCRYNHGPKQDGAADPYTFTRLGKVIMLPRSLHQAKLGQN